MYTNMVGLLPHIFRCTCIRLIPMHKVRILMLELHLLYHAKLRYYRCTILWTQPTWLWNVQDFWLVLLLLYHLHSLTNDMCGQDRNHEPRIYQNQLLFLFKTSFYFLPTYPHTSLLFKTFIIIWRFLWMNTISSASVHNVRYPIRGANLVSTEQLLRCA